LLNYYRQLTLPWLVAVSLMLIFTATWYQYEAKLQQRAQVQQFSAALQLAVAPYLVARNYQALGNQLTHASVVSSLPIQAIALLSNSGAILATSQTSVISEQIIQQQYISNQNISSYQLQKVEHLLVSLQPVSALQLAATADIPIDNAGQFYLLILVEHKLAFAVWMLPMLVVLVFGLAVLAWIKNTLLQQQQRQQVDISLVAHKLRQLQQGQYNCHIDEQLMPELEGIKQSFNALSEHYSEHQLNLQQQVTLQDTCLANLQTELGQATERAELLTQQQADYQLYFAYCMENLQLICQQKTGLESTDLRQLVSSQLTLLQLLALDTQFAAEDLVLTRFLAEQLPEYQAWFNHKHIKFLVFEAAANASHKVNFNPFLLSTLISALLHLASRNAAVQQVILRIELEANDGLNSLNISVVSDGEGLSPRQQQLFDVADITRLHWQDVDYAVLAVLMKKLDITKQIDTLEGLGCTTKLNIPLSQIEPINIKPLSSLLLFDADTEYLQERKQALAALANHVTYCSDLSGLEFNAQQSHIDDIIIFLPQPIGLSLWQQTLEKLALQSHVYCYASFDSVDVWRQALGDLVQPGVFSLHSLIAQVTKGVTKKLLVVDDNQTNLAFLQVLLKNQPIDLLLASTGQEALIRCQQQEFDVILLDIQLPDINGVEVARQLRSLENYQHTPILAFTAHALEHEKAEFIAAGMNDVILKPLQPNKLQQILQWCAVN
jgi:CheY-like chemotaxis protein